MAQPTRKPAAAAQVAQAQKAFTLAKSNLAKAKASAAADVTEDEDEDADAADPKTPEGEGDEDDTETDPDDEDDDKEDKPSDAVAIASSAEAKAHPAMANAAIASGQTLAQFKASVGAMGGGQRTSRLDAVMAGGRRLRPDATKAASGASAAMKARIEKNRSSRG